MGQGYDCRSVLIFVEAEAKNILLLPHPWAKGNVAPVLASEPASSFPRSPT